jgi:hypothetical protein
LRPPPLPRRRRDARWRPQQPWPQLSDPVPAQTVPPPRSSPATTVRAPVPLVRVLRARNAGRTLALTRKKRWWAASACRWRHPHPQGVILVPIEGAHAPVVNGAPAGAAGLAVRVGDVVEIAGARLELIVRDGSGQLTGSPSAASRRRARSHHLQFCRRSASAHRHRSSH